MIRNLRVELQRKRSQLTREVSDRIIRDPQTDVRDDIYRIIALDVILKTLPSPFWKRLWAPLAIGLASLSMVGVAWMVRVDVLGIRTNVLLTAGANTVELTTNREWQWSGQIRLPEGKVRIERAYISYSDPSQAFSAIDDAHRLDVEGGGYFSLQRLDLKARTRLVLETADGDDLAVYAWGTGASGDILVNGDVLVGWVGKSGPSQSMELALQIPEVITFSAANREAIPARVLFGRVPPFSLRDLHVSSIKFGREISQIPGEMAFISTVESGHIRLPSVQGSHDLFTGDKVRLSGLQGRIRRITVGSPITIDFEGTVERLSIGPSGGERDLTPSVLSYVYYNQPLAFLFSAASFLWGMLWSLRRLIGA